MARPMSALGDTMAKKKVRIGGTVGPSILSGSEDRGVPRSALMQQRAESDIKTKSGSRYSLTGGSPVYSSTFGPGTSPSGGMPLRPSIAMVRPDTHGRKRERRIRRPHSAIGTGPTLKMILERSKALTEARSKVEASDKKTKAKPLRPASAIEARSLERRRVALVTPGDGDEDELLAAFLKLGDDTSVDPNASDGGNDGGTIGILEGMVAGTGGHEDTGDQGEATARERTEADSDGSTVAEDETESEEEDHDGMETQAAEMEVLI